VRNAASGKQPWNIKFTQLRRETPAQILTRLFTVKCSKISACSFLSNASSSVPAYFQSFYFSNNFKLLRIVINLCTFQPCCVDFQFQNPKWNEKNIVRKIPQNTLPISC
jgi:hypothetical protein